MTSQFYRGAAISGLPLVLLAAPLLLHESRGAASGRYSTEYLALVGMAFAACLGVAIVAGLLCQRRSDLRPAYAVFALVASAVVSLVVAEVVLRVSSFNDNFANLARWGHQRSLVFGFEARPDHTWNAAGATYRTDDSGFRVRPGHPRGVEDPERRIYVLGGSSAFGYGLDDDETWAHLLERGLTEQFPSVGVINAGNNGYNSFQTLLRFYLKVLPRDPDVVVFYESRNDVSRRVLPPTGGYIAAEAVPWTTTGYLSVRFPSYNPYMKTLLFYGAHQAYRRIFDGPDLYPRIDGPTGEVARKANGAAYRRNVLALADLCERYGARLVLLTFLHDPANTPPWLTESMRYHNQLLRKLSDGESIPLVDLESRFQGVSDKASYFFEDAYHPSQRGAEYIAAQVEPTLAELLLEADSSAPPGS